MKILVVLPDAFDRYSFSLDRRHEFVFFEAAPSHWEPSPAFDPVAYLERARETARREKVEAVLSTHDLGDLIAAIIARELGLRGPTAEGVFLCLHKFYARRRELDPIRCEALPLAGNTASPPYPSYLKPPWLKLGILGFKLENDDDLTRAMAVVREEYPRWARQYYPLFARAVDLAQYPLATADMMLVEEFVEGPQVTVEGWVQDGQLGIWAVTDTNTYPGTRIIDNFSLPSRYPAEEMIRYTEETIRRFGLADTFFNIELWQTANGLRLTEVNGRAAVCFAGIYGPALGASIFEAVADVACGLPPQTMPRNTGLVAGQFNLISFDSDYAGNLADYAVAEAIAELSLFREADELVRPVSEFGVVLGQLEISGSSYEEIHARAEDVRRRVLKRHRSSPWVQ